MAALPPSRIVAIYPGSFDPITNGHLDMISRGSRLADRLIVAVLQNQAQAASLFTVEERVEMLTEVVKPYPTSRSAAFTDCWWIMSRPRGANFILRGIRAISDYEYELQIAHMNRLLQPGRRDRVSDGGRGVLVSSARNW